MPYLREYEKHGRKSARAANPEITTLLNNNNPPITINWLFFEQQLVFFWNFCPVSLVTIDWHQWENEFLINWNSCNGCSVFSVHSKRERSRNTCLPKTSNHISRNGAIEFIEIRWESRNLPISVSSWFLLAATIFCRQWSVDREMTTILSRRMFHSQEVVQYDW